MWASIVVALLPIAVKIILMAIDKKKMNEEARKALKKSFFNFIEKIAPHSQSCMKIRKSVEAQEQAILKARKK